jgi:hypothetical protein
MQYNKKKHLKLLKSSQKSESSRISFTDTDSEFSKFLDSQPKPDENFFELQSYSAMMICHLHWENREDYFELIEKLLNGPMRFLKLRKKHRAINDAGERLEAELILLEPNPKSEGFDDLIDELVSLFDRYCPDPSIRESHEFSEKELKEIVQKILFKMKKYYPEDSEENL